MTGLQRYIVGVVCVGHRTALIGFLVVVAGAAERKGEGHHVVLPAHLEWGAKIPNLAGGAVTISNARGVVCWDVKEQGASGCSGPSGRQADGGVGFLSEGEPAGALIHRTHDGFTWFSLNGRNGAMFRDNEGFYEFDVEVK